MASDYQPRISLPSWLVRNVATTAELAVYVDSVLTAPSSGTYTLTRPDGTAAVSAQNVTITASVATYAVTLATTESPGDGWQETWALVFSGVTHTFYRDAACRLRPYRCVIATADLERRHPELANNYPQTDTTAERAIEEATITVALHIMKDGRHPCMIVSPWSFREPQLLWALCYWFRSLATFAGDASRFQFYADKYEAEAKAALASMVFTYDLDDDNHPDVAEQGNSGGALTFLSNPPRGAFWRSHLPARRF